MEYKYLTIFAMVILSVKVYQKESVTIPTQQLTIAVSPVLDGYNTHPDLRSHS